MGHKWVICGSYLDYSVRQWVKWVNGYDPLSTLVFVARLFVMAQHSMTIANNPKIFIVKLTKVYVSHRYSMIFN